MTATVALDLLEARLRALLDGLLQDAAAVDVVSAAGEHATDTLAAREGFVQGIRYAENAIRVDLLGAAGEGARK